MKKFIKVAFTAFVFISLFPNISAAETTNVQGGYVAGNFSFLSSEVDEISISRDFDFTALAGTIGYSLNQNFAFEGRFGIGVTGDDISLFGVTVDVDVKNYVSALAKGSLPVDGGYIYGLVGYSSVEIEGSASGYSHSEDENGVSYGIGLEYPVSNNGLIGVEYLQIMDEDTLNLGGCNLFYRHIF